MTFLKNCLGSPYLLYPIVASTHTHIALGWYRAQSFCKKNDFTASRCKNAPLSLYGLKVEAHADYPLSPPHRGFPIVGRRCWPPRRLSATKSYGWIITRLARCPFLDSCVPSIVNLPPCSSNPLILLRLTSHGESVSNRYAPANLHFFLPTTISDICKFISAS